MADNKSTSKKKEVVSQETVSAGEYTKQIRNILYFLLFAVGVVVSISIASYFFNWFMDQGVVERDNVLDVSSLTNGSVDVANNGGLCGAIISNFFVGRLFGVGAIFVPIFIFELLYVLIIGRYNKIPKVFLKSAFGCVLVSLACSFVFSSTSTKFLLGNGLGGRYGYYVCQYLVSLLGGWGAGALILICFAIWLSFLSVNFVRWCNRLVLGLRKLAQERKEQKEAEALELEDDEDDITANVGVDDNEVVEGASLELTPEVDDNISSILEFEGDIHGPEPQEENDSPAESVETVESPAVEGVNLQVVMPNADRECVGGLDTVYDPRLDLSNYNFPSLDILADYNDRNHAVSREECESNSIRIKETLANFGISIEKITAVPGPTVTLYKIVLSPGVRISKVESMEKDIALSLAAKGVRIIAPIPGTNTVGIEVANQNTCIVSMRSVLNSQKFNETKMDLPIALGKTISNEVFMVDLAKMPHLLVAGATGMGKSVGLNVILTSLLYKIHPAYLKFVLVDPKKVEFSLYSKLERHYLAKLPSEEEAIITDTKKVVATLRSLCQEMDTRYNLLKKAGVRNLKEYNEKFLSRRLNPLEGHKFMPFIVVVMDEFGDLIITAGKEVEEPLTRLAQLARAIGIHLVIATQRPTTNVITGGIKSQFPARIAFRVMSSIDSKTILDATAAKDLIGNGDMLVMAGAETTRVQCAFISTDEIKQLVENISCQQSYPSAFDLPEVIDDECGGGDDGYSGNGEVSSYDNLFAEAARLVVSSQQGSTSNIQRRFTIGYPRAGKIMDQLEKAGIVGKQESPGKPRVVNIYSLDDLEQKLRAMGLD